MIGKILRCTFCGAQIPYTDEEKVTCPHCDSVNYFRFASRLGEKQDAERVAVLRKRLRECVGEKYHDFTEMKRIADEILNLTGYDFEAKYFYALALKQNNKRGKYNEFLTSAVNLAPNEDSLNLVLENVIRYARQNERTAIHTFIERTVSDPLAREEYADRADRQIERAVRDYHGGQDVFVCHKSDDGAVAWAVVDRLESEGLTCFIAERNLEDLEVGEKFENALKAAIASCKVFLFISSPSAFALDEDNYALLEVAEAGRLNKPLAEFRVAAVEREQERAATAYKAFKGCQYIEAYPYYVDMLDRLSAHLKEKLSRLDEGSDFERVKRRLEAESKAKEEEIKRLLDEQEQTKKMLERIEFEKEEALKKLHALEEQGSAAKSTSVSDGGDPAAESLYRRALKLDFGGASEDDKREAVRLYRAAADLGHAGAMFNLGVSYEEGDGVAPDVSEANRWYILAVEAGSASAMFNLGNNYRIGRGVPKNPARAFELFSRSAAAGNIDALVNLGVAYERGEGVAPDFKRAVECYKSAATAGSSAAAYNLALCYRSGVGTERSEELFRYWLEKAAADGGTEAAGLLGEIENAPSDVEAIYRKACDYDYGKGGVKQDKTAAFELYARAAKQGYAPAMLNLGVAYEYGDGTERDLKAAVEWYTRAAAKGNAMAQCNLGYCYYVGNGTARDLKAAIEWYGKAAENGSARAYNNLGYCYEHGEGVRRDVKRAFECYKTAAIRGDIDGACNVAWCYESGLGTAVDLVKAREWFAVAREKGVERGTRGYERVDAKLMYCPAAAQELYRKGCTYDFGDGVKPNRNRAVELYARAARGGCLPAQYNLGICYLEERSPDYVRALDCFAAAARKGHCKAALWAGKLFEKGQGTAVNLKTAAAYYEWAAKAGESEAQWRLGSLYERGQGVKCDLDEAFKWYKRSAAGNNAQGLVLLGNCYAEGKGTRKDGSSAFDCYQRAADDGDATAMFNLGLCYHNGIGVQPDRAEEKHWYTLAADAGCAEARDALQGITD